MSNRSNRQPTTALISNPAFDEADRFGTASGVERLNTLEFATFDPTLSIKEAELSRHFKDSVEADKLLADLQNFALSQIRSIVYRIGLICCTRERDDDLEQVESDINQNLQCELDAQKQSYEHWIECVITEHRRASEQYRSQFQELLERNNPNSVIISPLSLDLVLSILDEEKRLRIQHSDVLYQDRQNELAHNYRHALHERQHLVGLAFDSKVEKLKNQLAQMTDVVDILRLSHEIFSALESPTQNTPFVLSSKSVRKVIRYAFEEDRKELAKAFSFPKLESQLRQAKFAKTRTITDLSPESVWNLMTNDHLR